MKAAYHAVAHGWTSHKATRAPMPWLAEIAGTDTTYGYQRRFLTAKADHPRARDTRAITDVVYWWTLQSGRLYQAKFLTGLRGGWVTQWMTVTDDGDIVALTREEADRWLLANACSASMS